MTDRAPADRARAERFAAEAAEATTLVTREEMVGRTRRSILTGLAAAGLGGLGWGWLQRQPEAGNIPWVLRRGFEWNEVVWSTLYDPGRLAPEFPADAVEDLRVNGGLGLDGPVDATTWRLEVADADDRVVDRLAIDEVTANLPTVEQVTEHKCIEGWSAVVAWTGVRFADVLTRYPDLAADATHVGLATPDGEYYVGLDMDSAMHPQTLLATGLNGVPLTPDHGAPLRLVTPLQYGIKSIKRIGRITFGRDRPADYWAERGYDWDSSH